MKPILWKFARLFWVLCSRFVASRWASPVHKSVVDLGPTNSPARDKESDIWKKRLRKYAGACSMTKHLGQAESCLWNQLAVLRWYLSWSPSEEVKVFRRLSSRAAMARTLQRTQNICR